jgi:hypothetical protein
VTHYALGPKVEHYDPDASFNDSVWWHCRLTVATYPTEPEHRFDGGLCIDCPAVEPTHHGGDQDE